MAAVGEIDANLRVQYRSNMGRFVKLADRAAHGMANDMTETTASIVAHDAPKGPARTDYGRRPKIRNALHHDQRGLVGDVWLDPTLHGMPQETGARAHPIPNAFGRGITVLHPGNAPQPFFRGALRKLQPRLPGMLQKWYGALG